jgi:hypothetical protein
LLGFHPEDEGDIPSETSVDFHPTTKRYTPEILNSDSFQEGVNIFIDLVQVTSAELKLFATPHCLQCECMGFRSIKETHLPLLPPFVELKRKRAGRRDIFHTFVGTHYLCFGILTGAY